MSYILDALRKAERERGLRQVPTLMTEHASRKANSKRIWAGLGILVIAGAAIAGWHFLKQREILPSASKDRAEYGKASEGTNAGPGEPSAAARSLPATGASGQSPAAAGPDSTSSKSAGASAAVKRPFPPAPRDAFREPPLPNIRRMSPPEEEDAVEEQDEETLPPREPLRRAPPAAKDAQEPPQAKPASLQDAVGKMTLSLLVYAENKEDRMVYINGRKYVEGDNVEGIYHLDSITEDGAVLSYQGQRALLQPKPK